MPSPLSLSAPARRAMGLAGLPDVIPAQPAPTPEQVLPYQVTASGAATLAERAKRDRKITSIAGAIGTSIGVSVALSASGRDAQLVGAGLAGIGGAFLGCAIVAYMREQNAILVRDSFAKALLSAGYPAPGVPEILLEKSAGK